jgi:NADH-quinone oxidoreductase subunit F
MDLKPIAAEPTPEERAAIDALLGDPEPNTETRPLREAERIRDRLLPALHALARAVGWVSPGGLGYACRRLSVPPAEGYGVATFYSLFALDPRPPVVVHVCDDVVCQTRGAAQITEALETSEFAEWPSHGGTNPSGGEPRPVWSKSPCLGLCERAPAALFTKAGAAPHEALVGHATSATLLEALRTKEPPAFVPTIPPQHGDPGLRLLARIGRVDPTSLDDYRAHGGYAALRRAIELGPRAVVREVAASGLVGRGGAAFPTGRKWEAVQRAPERPHYVICNADESEPGTFKDRVLLEGDPFAVVEAMTIAGLATGAERGFVYVRGEYPLAIERLEHAIASARARGLLGDDVLGKGLRFDLEVRRGAGAYICGEETALIASIEGFRGEPRTKPPFPVDRGLFGKPTAVNNVETLVAALDIVRDGAEWYRAAGTAGSPGTKLFCVSGAIATPGVYEVPFGMRLDALLALAGGTVDGRAPRAVLLGGAAGTFVTGDELAMPLTFEDTRARGATLGSGVVFVVGSGAPVAPLLSRIAQFFRDESCGQCVPCRVGTVRQEELVARLTRGAPLGTVDDELALLRDLGQAMRDASICGLGQTASSAIESAVVRLPILPREAP